MAEFVGTVGPDDLEGTPEADRIFGLWATTCCPAWAATPS